jgi:hypothetical protein
MRGNPLSGNSTKDKKHPYEQSRQSRHSRLYAGEPGIAQVPCHRIGLWSTERMRRSIILTKFTGSKSSTFVGRFGQDTSGAAAARQSCERDGVVPVYHGFS